MMKIISSKLIQNLIQILVSDFTVYQIFSVGIEIIDDNDNGMLSLQGHYDVYRNYIDLIYVIFSDFLSSTYYRPSGWSPKIRAIGT